MGWNEVWRDIKGYRGYQVSDKGNVRSRVIKGSKQSNLTDDFHAIIPHDDSNGYLVVTIRGKHLKIHRLVAETFIPNPKAYPVVRHRDGKRHHNVKSNLAWGTQRMNIHDAIRQGTFIGDTSKAVAARKLKIVGMNTKTHVKMCFDSITDAAHALKLQPSHISEVLRGKLNHTGNWVFERRNASETFLR